MQVRGPGYRGGVDLERPLVKSGSGAPFSRQMCSRQPLLEGQCHPHSFRLSQGLSVGQDLCLMWAALRALRMIPPFYAKDLKLQNQ